MEKRHLDQALNAKEFAVCAGVFRLYAAPPFGVPRLRGPGPSAPCAFHPSYPSYPSHFHPSAFFLQHFHHGSSDFWARSFKRP